MEQKDELLTIQLQELRERMDKGLAQAERAEGVDGEVFMPRRRRHSRIKTQTGMSGYILLPVAQEDLAEIRDYSHGEQDAIANFLGGPFQGRPTRGLYALQQKDRAIFGEVFAYQSGARCTSEKPERFDEFYKHLPGNTTPGFFQIGLLHKTAA